jgi:DNA-binding transcriptional LysR family regulator
MNLHQIRSFVTVVEELSFRRAAARLHITQPPLTRHIQALEEDLGVRLLERDRRSRIVLTDAGQSFLTDAKLLLSTAASARQKVKEVSQGSRGRLRIASVAALSSGVLPKFLHDFRSSFPNVHIRMFEMEPAEQLAALAEERIHASLLPGLGTPLEQRFEGLPIFSCPMVAVLPPGHRFARGTSSLDIKRLVKDNILIHAPEWAPGYMTAFRLLCSLSGFSPSTTQPVEGLQNLLSMVAAGYGVAILPKVSVNEKRSNYFTRLLSPPVPKFQLKLTWLSSSRSQFLPKLIAISQRYSASLQP